MTRDNGGNMPKGENKKIIDELQKFYDQFYSKLGYGNDDKINSLHLSQSPSKERSLLKACTFGDIDAS